MAQLVSDNFNRIDSANLGSNWTLVFGNNWRIVSNQAAGPVAVAGDQLVAYTGASWTGGADQYVEITVQTKPSQYDLSSCCRCATVQADGYFFEINDNDTTSVLGASLRCQLFKVINESYTVVGSSASFVVNAGDVVRIEAQGTTITGKLNGVTKLGPATDSGIANGKPGMNQGGNPPASFCTVSLFAAGDFTVTASTSRRRVLIIN
jgi:hypothetical protein